MIVWTVHHFREWHPGQTERVSFLSRKGAERFRGSLPAESCARIVREAVDGRLWNPPGLGYPLGARIYPGGGVATPKNPRRPTGRKPGRRVSAKTRQFLTCLEFVRYPPLPKIVT